MLCTHRTGVIFFSRQIQMHVTDSNLTEFSRWWLRSLLYDIGNDPKTDYDFDRSSIFQQSATLYHIRVGKKIVSVFIRSSYCIEETIKIRSVTALFSSSVSLVQLHIVCMIGEGEGAKVSMFSLLIISTELSIITALLLKFIVQTERRLACMDFI